MKTLVISILMFLLSLSPSYGLYYEDWNKGSLAEWSGKNISNPSNYLSILFKSQSFPRIEQNLIIYRFLPGVNINNVSFRFKSLDTKPSNLKIVIHSPINNRTWHTSLDISKTTDWAYFNVDVDFTKFSSGPTGTKKLFNESMQMIDWIGVYITRSGSTMVQRYAIDDMLLDANIDKTLDTDKDAVPDYWELRYGLSVTNASDAQLDKDGDGMNNFKEYWSGTDPNDPLSLLELTTVWIDEDMIRLNIFNMLIRWETHGAIYICICPLTKQPIVLQ